MAVAAKYRFDFEDFCALVHEDQKADLIDGVIYMASPENIENYNLFGWLLRLTGDFLDEMNDGGRLFGSRIAFQLDDENAPEPDLAYLLPSRLHLIRKSRIAGRPDWALEIVSPESVERDYETKRKQFEHFKVPEYWIVDPMEQRLTCLLLSGTGKYREVKPRNGIVRSSVITGFCLRVSWLWQSPLPPKNQALAQMLEWARRRQGNGHIEN